jgi:hypothetical protein
MRWNVKRETRNMRSGESYTFEMFHTQDPTQPQRWQGRLGARYECTLCGRRRSGAGEKELVSRYVAWRAMYVCVCIVFLCVSSVIS